MSKTKTKKKAKRVSGGKKEAITVSDNAVGHRVILLMRKFRQQKVAKQPLLCKQFGKNSPILPAQGINSSFFTV